MTVTVTATVLPKPPGCRFQVAFTVVDNSSGTTQNFDGIDISFTSFDQPCKKNFWGFLPWESDCDPPDVFIEAETHAYIPDENFITGHNILTDIELQDDPTKTGSCWLYHLKWSAYYWSKTNPTNPVKMKAKGPLKFEAGASYVADFSGSFTIRVCCVKTDDGCVRKCELAK